MYHTAVHHRPREGASLLPILTVVFVLAGLFRIAQSGMRKYLCAMAQESSKCYLLWLIEGVRQGSNHERYGIVTCLCRDFRFHRCDSRQFYTP